VLSVYTDSENAIAFELGIESRQQILRRCVLWSVVQGCLSLMVASTSVLWLRVTASQDLL
jgi:hypothetical protein